MFAGFTVGLRRAGAGVVAGGHRPSRSSWVWEFLFAVELVVPVLLDVELPDDVPEPGVVRVDVLGALMVDVPRPGDVSDLAPGDVSPGDTVEPPRKPPEKDPMLPLDAAPPDRPPPPDELAAWPELTLAARMSALQPAATYNDRMIKIPSWSCWHYSVQRTLLMPVPRITGGRVAADQALWTSSRPRPSARHCKQDLFVNEL